MTDWTSQFTPIERKNRAEFSVSLIEAMDMEFLTRKPRDEVKRELMKQLGLPERYTEVQYPSPGNTPSDLYERDL